MRGEAVGNGIVDSASVDIRDCHRCATRLTSHGGGEKADCASANDKGGRAWRRGGTVDGMDGYRERLQERCGVIRNVVRKFVTPDGWVVDPLLEGALVVRIGLSTAPEAQLLAKVVAALAADSALSAGYANLEGNTVAELEALDLWANGHHLARGLVAKREGLACAEVTIGELLVVGNVGTANAGSLDGNLQLASAWGV
jgi:hypothetical protein